MKVASRLAKVLGGGTRLPRWQYELELEHATLKRVEDISKMPDKDRSFILRTLDALVRDMKAQKAYAIREA